MSEQVLQGPQDVMKDPGENIIFATYTLKKQDDTKQTIQMLALYMQSFVDSMNVRYPDQHFRFAFGIGSDAWDYLFPNSPKPKELVKFKEVKGPKVNAVSTPGDLFFHIRADKMAICYEIHEQCYDIIKGVVDLVDETHGFRYFEGRSIIGFVDGTKNPTKDEIPEFAIVGNEDPEFINGSYAFAQKYLHDMTYWNNLTVENQEKSIGRAKYNDKELMPTEKLKNAHNVVSKDLRGGVNYKIVRMNVPFANAGKDQVGTYFIGYSRSFEVTNNMVTNMFEGNPKGNYDRLLDFSTPITGNLFFIPSYDILLQIALGTL